MKIKLLFFSFIVILTCSSNAQVTFTSSNLPVITINTYGQTIVNEPKINAWIRIIDNGPGKRNSAADSANVYSGKIGIELRGQSSQQFPKKPYGLETRDAAGENLDVSIFGMPADNDWILYPSYSDKTLMRNAIAYKLYNGLGRYASRTKHCEVILNGTYIGVYVFMEKIKRGSGRVPIKKLEAKDISGDALTGGYIVKIDKADAGQNQGWTSAYRPPDGSQYTISYLYTYPDQEDITAEQKSYIKNYISRFEDIMYSKTFNDPFNGYYDYIDVASFIDTYLLFEITKNVDAYRLSTYFFKNKNSVDGRLNYGPVWDLDFGFGNCDYDNASSIVGWEVQNKNASSWLTPFWNRTLMNDPVFFNALSKRWNKCKNTVFNFTTISTIIDSVANAIDEAKTRNFQKWNILGTYVWPNAYVGSNYADEIKYLKTWIQGRSGWINSVLTTSYSDLSWLNLDTSYTNLRTGVIKRIPLSKIFNIIQNVDSVCFVSSGGPIISKIVNDTLLLSASEAGTYKLKGAVYKNKVICEYSATYSFTSSGVSDVASEGIRADSFLLLQNYPNPFNPATNITFQIPKASRVFLKIFDLLGREVCQLVNGYKTAGRYNVYFDASNLPCGVYIYSLNSGGVVLNSKMIFLK